MVSRRVDPASRRRCPRACDVCKRRKERCDGAQPCKRCTDRGVGGTCCFEAEHRQRKLRTRDIHLRKQVKAVQPTSFTGNEKGNGEAILSHVPEQISATTSGTGSTQSHDEEEEADAVNAPADTPAPTARQPSATSPGSISVDHSRFIQDKRGRYIFIGDSANLSFLHTVRCVVSDALGPCPFVDDPLRSSMVEAIPEIATKRPDFYGPGSSLPGISKYTAVTLTRRFFEVTDGAVDLFEETDIVSALPHILSPTSHIASAKRAVVYMILAIGSQSSEDNISLADTYFNHGRFLTGHYLTEDVSIQSTQLYVLICLYLLGASRRNVAFVCLGHATRSAYSLGLHQQSVAGLFSEAETRERARLWKSIRVLDLFTSASLGRPPSTTLYTFDDPKEMTITDELYAILETILTDVYGKRKITTDILARIGSRLRKWATKYGRSLSTPSSKEADASMSQQQDIGSMNLKQAYYWTIMLLTRPFLVDRVTAHAKEVSAKSNQTIQPCVTEGPSKTLIHACIDSAVKTISLLEPLLGYEQVPRHLPLLINAAFHAALVLGFAFFGDMYLVFPLERTLQKAVDLLQLFPHDSVGMRYLAITQYLRTACSTYVEKRRTNSMDFESQAISHLFGQIHVPKAKQHKHAHSHPRSSVGVQRFLPDDKGPNCQTALDSDPSVATRLVNYGESLDGIVLSSPDTIIESDLLEHFSQQSELNLDFPMIAQHVWVDSGSDLPSAFVGMDVMDVDMSFLEQ